LDDETRKTRRSQEKKKNLKLPDREESGDNCGTKEKGANWISQNTRTKENVMGKGVVTRKK